MSLSSSSCRSRQLLQIRCYRNQKILKGSTKSTKKSRTSDDILDDKYISHMQWWKEVCRLKHSYYEYKLGVSFSVACTVFPSCSKRSDSIVLYLFLQRLQICRKPSTVHLVSRIVYSNLLGVDVNLKNGRWFLVILSRALHVCLDTCFSETKTDLKSRSNCIIVKNWFLLCSTNR